MAKGSNGTGKPYRRGDIWWIRFRVSGETKRREESSHSTVRADAVRLLNQRRSEADKRQICPAGATVGNLLDMYIVQAEMKGNSAQQSVKADLENHLRTFFGKIPCAEISTADITRFKALKKKEGKANSSINRYLATLKTALKLGQENVPPLITIIPKIKKLPENNTRTNVFTTEQYLLLMEKLPKHQQRLLTLGRTLGMRLGELTGIRWGQLDYKAGIIRLDWNQTKTGEGREAPMIDVLKEYLEKEYDGEPMTQTVVAWRGLPIRQTKTAWNKACENAGCPGMHIHDLRRTAIRLMLDSGLDQKTIMMITGHKTDVTFRRYVIVDRPRLKLAGAKLNAHVIETTAQAKVDMAAEAQKLLEAKGTIEGTVASDLIM